MAIQAYGDEFGTPIKKLPKKNPGMDEFGNPLPENGPVLQPDGSTPTDSGFSQVPPPTPTVAPPTPAPSAPAAPAPTDTIAPTPLALPPLSPAPQPGPGEPGGPIPIEGNNPLPKPVGAVSPTGQVTPINPLAPSTPAPPSGPGMDTGLGFDPKTITPNGDVGGNEGMQLGGKTITENLGLGGNSPAPNIPAPTQDPIVGSTGGQEFGPENDLISQTILPESDPYLTTPIQRAPSERYMKLMGLTDDQINQIVKGPDRVQMAKDKWDNFVKQTDPDYQLSLRNATDQAAANGRLFSGILTNKYGDVATTRARDLDVARNNFLGDAADKAVKDKFDILSALRGVSADAYNADSDNYNSQVSERDSLRDYGGSVRNEARTERDYQRSMAQEALLRRILQYQMETGQQQQEFDNGQTLFNTGNEGNPTNLELGAAGQELGQADEGYNDIAELLKLWAQRRSATNVQ